MSSCLRSIWQWIKDKFCCLLPSYKRNESDRIKSVIEACEKIKIRNEEDNYKYYSDRGFGYADLLDVNIR